MSCREEISVYHVSVSKIGGNASCFWREFESSFKPLFPHFFHKGLILDSVRLLRRRGNVWSQLYEQKVFYWFSKCPCEIRLRQRRGGNACWMFVRSEQVGEKLTWKVMWSRKPRTFRFWPSIEKDKDTEPERKRETEREREREKRERDRKGERES